MTKDVLLSIQGLQFDTGAEENGLETITAAEYYKKNNHHYVIYEEAMEGFHDKTKNIIKWDGQSVDLTKRGLVNVHMVFEENKKNMTDYKTPFGNILIGIDTRQVRMEEKEERIELQVNYALEINYEYLADCMITMNISPRESVGLEL